MTSQPRKPSGPLSPPFRVFSVHFAHSSAQASVTLRDPKDDTMVGIHPEWCDGDAATKHPPRHAPAAYAASEMSDENPPTILVVFRRSGWAPEGTPGRRKADDEASRTYRIGAEAASGPVGVALTEHEVEFDALGFSKPLEFPLTGPLPREIARHHLVWRWRLETDDDAPMTDTIGITDHDVYTTWKRPVNPQTWMLAPTPLPLMPPGQPWTEFWAYTPIVEWTCEWAAGATGDKSICDAIIANCWKSGLTYGGSGVSVRSMLNEGGGMCGGWFQMFQAMAGCHGVEVLRRAFYVDWRERGEEVLWCAIVVQAAGVNQPYPTFDPHLYHDLEEMPPPGKVSKPKQVVERRYRFWGSPSVRIHDGHCINYLDCDEGMFLYDCCFLDKPVEVDMIPEKSIREAVPLSATGNFKEAYLDKYVTFMLGSLDLGDGVFRTILPETFPGKRRWRGDGLFSQIDFLNGVTVRTEGIAKEGDDITFYWGG